MVVQSGSTLAYQRFIQPHLEPEIAFWQADEVWGLFVQRSLKSKELIPMEPENNQPLRSDAREDATPDMDGEDPSLLVRREVLKGSRLGDVRVRIVLPRRRAFQRVSE